MDPLSDQLACDCVAGYAKRDYDRLGEFLEEKLSRPVEISYTESLALPQAGTKRGVDLIIGKFSEVTFDAAKAALGVRTMAMLTGLDGSMTLTGLFVVRQDDTAKSIADLKDYRLLLGPEDSLEKRPAALASLEAFDLPVPSEVPSSSSCSSAALAVVEGDADAAVISSYAMPLLEGCGTVDKGTLRIVGRTDPVPFICVFATDRVDAKLERELLRSMLALNDQPELLAAMESKSGFVGLPDVGRSETDPVAGWTDWRGPERDALSPCVPEKLPGERRLLWSRILTGPGVAGMAADSLRVVVADKDLYGQNDIYRCLDADTGRQLWKISYPAGGEMDYTNSARANPVIHEGLVYLLGAFGDLHCLKLDTGKLLWKRQIVHDFLAKLPTWGICSTPLLIGDKLIVNPGAEDASLAALDRLTGDVLWTVPGDPPGYSSFVLAKFGGVKQIVGYDAISLGGWDPDSGDRLWKLVPEWEGDFNVPTPIVVGDQLLVTTENNGTRLYDFDGQGRIKPEPAAVNEDFAPDTSTPLVIDGRMFGNFGGLWCLDVNDNLKTLWETDEDPFADYCSLIGGNGRVLVISQPGTLFLLDTSQDRFAPISKLDLFPDVRDTERDVWSHPALVGNRLYVRNLLGVYCFLLK